MIGGFILLKYSNGVVILNYYAIENLEAERLNYDMYICVKNNEIK
jgi:hypothetical protein